LGGARHRSAMNASSTPGIAFSANDIFVEQPPHCILVTFTESVCIMTPI
jgi:hypothetical protein